VGVDLDNPMGYDSTNAYTTEEDYTMKKQQGFTLIEMVISLLVIFGAIGWVMNIYFLIQAAASEIWINTIIRAIGVFIPPVGAVMGYIPF